ncbi:MAG: 4-hydroxy-tetrahydrodipicolinate reductase [Rhodothermaceae bacterium]|nr:4-hydroxy-tetrahydrodipicolinate reductase [Rhodothermaceae bacterium]MXX58544.1 4-hydroxy-tetrahydrodipicolinate reductase [Rhodothermaceae bacterium]MYD18873.1 4-hydroxy-tetrahydrodipicolinate reductase [Rhodothermaceae bacterium]MYD55912.1 4-hydroxy-tetrahydrodipicolinate reductase [Rhodothermaceae bacterium]MYI44747.1 4-hydroxy-tetrahydrodipicolinate reductase [Rhodothermaceae bacterium]
MSVSLQIAIAGTGRMGSAVAASAVSRGHEISQYFNRENPVTEAALYRKPDVVIDFTQPAITVQNIASYCRANVPAVVGTTGWYDEVADVRRLVNKHNAAVLYSPNFSLGIQLILQSLRAMAPLLNKLPEFDVALHELHHTAKTDSPSGTAINLATELVKNIERKHKWGGSTTPHDPSQLEVSATRLGHAFGQHQVIIDSPADYILLEHTAKSRDGFALGAVRAAEWIQGRTGLFTLEDMLSDWFQ